MPGAGTPLQLQSTGSRSRITWACLLRGTWDLPKPGTEPMSPTPAGRVLSTASPGKSSRVYFQDKRFLVDVFIGTDIKAERPGHFQSPTDM